MISALDQIEAQNRDAIRTICDGLSGTKAIEAALNGCGAMSALQAQMNVSAAISAALAPPTFTGIDIRDVFPGIGLT